MRRMTGLSVVVCWAFCSQTVAGPDWNEGGSDAGSTVGTQRAVSRLGGGALASVGGATSSGLLVADQHDLIEIYISDPENFFFHLPLLGEWDSRLYLFRGEGHGVGDPPGEPLLMNDNSRDNEWGIVNIRASFGNLTGSMTSALNSIGEVFPAGRYLIAITGNGSVPGIWLGGSWIFLPSFNTPYFGYGLRTNSSNDWVWQSSAISTSGSWGFATQGTIALPAENCRDAELVTGFGSRPVDNVIALDGPSFPYACGATRDIWYRLVVNCGNTIRISTCGTVDFDSVIEVYAGDCDTATLVNCENDGCGDADGATRVEFAANASPTGEYLVRVGSRCGSPGGVGTIKFECVDRNDINGDGVVNGFDLAELLSNWTGPPDDPGR